MRRLPLVWFTLLIWTHTASRGYANPWQNTPADDAAASFASEWEQTPDRVWPGAEYYANRFLDWRVAEGRLECVTGDRKRPMRTVHLLSYYCDEGAGDLSMSVETGSLLPRPPERTTWTGFLIGVGGEHVDFRTSALCHHWPGPDGGFIAALDGSGRVVFRDNSQFSSRNPESVDAWPLLPTTDEEGDGWGVAGPRPVRLQLSAIADHDGVRLQLSAVDAADDTLIHRASVQGIQQRSLSGNIALVSHSFQESSGPGYWFRQWRAEGSSLRHDPDREFGPILAAQHTVSGNVLKMTVQMPVLGNFDSTTATLEVRGSAESDWNLVATGKLIPHSFIIPFRVESWDDRQDNAYRITYQLQHRDGSTTPHYYSGTIRRNPTDREEFTVAAFTGHHISAKGAGHWNGGSIWYPHTKLVDAVEYHQPDMLFFSGDQIYESGLAGVVRSPPEIAAIDYQYHWVRWCWAFRDLARDRPCFCLPDDHDVYHGNIWGAGGRRATRQKGVGKYASDSGGYTMDPLFVNAVHETQTHHLPDPVDPKPIEQGISVYFTRMEYAGISFAILADRMFKSSPSVQCPEGNCANGWFLNPDFDPTRDADPPNATLLGDRQLAFLEEWAQDWRNGAWMKTVLSQTIFANVATIPANANNDAIVPRMRYAAPGEYIDGDQLAADADSNSWPPSGRNRAVRVIRKAFAFHIAGDQHLGSLTRYGVDDWRDASYAFCVPSIANVWPRRWFPPTPGMNRSDGEPPYTGDFRDGFGNRITVYAVSNPVESGVEPKLLHDRAPGYGIVHFRRPTREIEIECWPRWIDPSQPDAKQYFGWPRTIRQMDNYAREPIAHLPPLEFPAKDEPVVQVVHEPSQEIVYTIRISGPSFTPPVFQPGTYTVRMGEPGTERWRTVTGISPVANPAATKPRDEREE